MSVDGRLADAVAHAPAALADGSRGIHDGAPGGDVEDDAVTAGDHPGQHQPGQVDRGDRVGLDLLLDQFHRRVHEPVHVTGADVAAVVHEHVYVAPALLDGGHRGPQ